MLIKVILHLERGPIKKDTGGGQWLVGATEWNEDRMGWGNDK